MCMLTSTQAHVSRDPHICGLGLSYVGAPRICSPAYTAGASDLFPLSPSLSLSAYTAGASYRHTPHPLRISARLHQTPSSSLSPILLTSHGGRSRGIWTSTRSLRHAQHARALSTCAAPRRPTQSCAETLCSAEKLTVLVSVLGLCVGSLPGIQTCRVQYTTSVRVRHSAPYKTRTLPLPQVYEQSYSWMQRPMRPRYQSMLPST
jgi:hypothetical protein